MLIEKFIRPKWRDTISSINRKQYSEIYFGRIRLVIREENPWVCYCAGLFEWNRLQAKTLEIAQLMAIEKLHNVLHSTLYELYLKLGVCK